MHIPWQLRGKHRALLCCRSRAAVELLSEASPSRFWRNLPFFAKSNTSFGKISQNNNTEITNGVSLSESVFLLENLRNYIKTNFITFLR